MARVIGYWVFILALNPLFWLGKPLPAPDAEFSLSTPLAASVGEAQVWYLSINSPAGQTISGLKIENGAPDAWAFQPQQIPTLNRSQRVAIPVTALKAGASQPSLLLSYRLGDEDVQRVTQGQAVAIVRVEDQLRAQIVSASTSVTANQPGWLDVLVENQSPFPANVSLSVEMPEANVQTQPLKLALKPGERNYQKILLSVPHTATPLLSATFDWTDSRQEAHTVSVQAASQVITRQLVNWDAPGLSGLLNILIGGLISLAASLATLEARRRLDLRNQYERDRRQVESLMQMVLLNFKQAYANRVQVDTHYLDELLLNNNLFQILRGQEVQKEAQDLWLAVQSYNRAYDSARFSEQNYRLKEAMDAYEAAWNSYQKPRGQVRRWWQPGKERK